MKFYYTCPKCLHDVETNADIESLEEAIGCTITCLCGSDILITEIDTSNPGIINKVNCSSLIYDSFISIDTTEVKDAS